MELAMGIAAASAIEVFATATRFGMVRGLGQVEGAESPSRLISRLLSIRGGLRPMIKGRSR